MHNKKLVNFLENHAKGSVREAFVEAAKGTHYKIFRQVLDSLDKGLFYPSELHGITHTERVSFLGLLLSDRLKMSEADTKLFLTACAYHDIGRQNDGTDDLHGARSAGEVAKYTDFTEEELQILKAVIEAHSLSDGKMLETIKKYSVRDEERAMFIAKALKDADGLDRVRLGDLDPHYLRFKESLELIDLAEELFWVYH
jgi:HD superfamily phosphodiesterase